MAFDITPWKVSEYELGLSRMVGKQIQEIFGYVSGISSEPSFKLTKIQFDDGTFLGVEGEHDFPYVVEYGRETQPHMDEDSLEEIKKQQGDK